MLDIAGTIILLTRTLAHFVLTMLCFFAAAGWAAWKGARDLVTLGMTGLIGIALPGYLAFWLWFFWRPAGHLFSFFVPFTAVWTIVWSWTRLDARGRLSLKAMLIPAALVGIVALAVLAAGFAYGGMDNSLTTAAVRFSHPLPADNRLPFLFAEAVKDDRIPKPFFGDWLSSDRPPLETGLTLLNYPYMPRPRDLGYEVLAAILQSLWVLGVWLFLIAFRIEGRLIGFILGVTFCSGFIFVNTFFVWPKLLAATFMLAFGAIVLSPAYSARIRESLLLCAGAGALLSFGLLSHGGSAFALIGIAITALLLRRRIGMKALAIVAVTCLVTYLPWLLYQKVYDPPGNRLLKYHLAGVTQVDKRSFTQTLRDSYSHLTFREWLEIRESNVERMIGPQPEFWRNLGRLLTSTKPNSQGAQLAFLLRDRTFFTLGGCLAVLLVGPLALLIGVVERRRTRNWRVAALIWLCVACTLVPWNVLMFARTTTVIHQGTYAVVLLAIAGSLMALWSVSPKLAIAAGLLQICLNFLLYGIYSNPQGTPGVGTGTRLRYGEFGLFMLAFVAAWLLVLKMTKNQTSAACPAGRDRIDRAAGPRCDE